MALERRAPVNKWAVGVAVAVALAFLYVVRLAVLPFLIAAAIAYIASPAFRWLHRRLRLSRVNAAMAIYTFVLALFSALSYAVFTMLAGDLSSVITHAPQLIHKFLSELFAGERMQIFGRELDAGEITQRIVDSAFSSFSQPLQWLDVALYVFGGFTAIVLIIVLLFYFLTAGPQLARGVLWLVPPEYREEVAEIAAKIDPMLRRYLVGLSIIVVIATGMSWLAIRFALGLPFAFLLALLTGLLELIPVLGPMISAGLIGLLSLEQHGLWAVVAFAIYVTAFRLVIDRVLGPVVLGHAAKLHPTVVIFAFLAGGLFLGVAGVILAVPVAAGVKIVLEHYYAQPMQGQRLHAAHRQ